MASSRRAARSTIPREGRRRPDFVIYLRLHERLDKQSDRLSAVKRELDALRGDVSDRLLQYAEEILDAVPGRSREEPLRTQLNAVEFARRAQEELGYYQKQCADFSATVAVREDLFACRGPRAGTISRASLPFSQGNR